MFHLFRSLEANLQYLIVFEIESNFDSIKWYRFFYLIFRLLILFYYSEFMWNIESIGEIDEVKESKEDVE